MDLSGNLRVVGTFPTAPPAKATAAAPTYVEGTNDPLSMDLSGSLRTIISGALAAGSNIIGTVKMVDSGGTNLASISAAGAQKVDGSAVTQPVSAVSLPLPTGAATLAKQPALGTAGAASADVITVQGIAGGTAQPISAASLPLPTGAATLAKQPALGTAGVASADVITIQGIAAGTVVPISVASLPLPTGAATLAKQPALGVAGTPSTDVITIQGIASGTVVPVSAASLPLPTGAATSALQSSVQGSVAGGTAGTASQLMGGVFNTTLPTLTTGQQAAVQLDVNGKQIVTSKLSTSSASVSSAAVGATFDTTGQDTAAFQITSIGTTNTVVFEGSNDNATWLTLPVLRADQITPTPVLSMTTVGGVVTPCRFQFIRWRVSVFTSGTVTVFTSLRTSPQAQLDMAVDIISALPAGTNKIGVVQQSGTLTDRSGTVATGTTSQQLMAANANRKYLLIENASSTESLFINFTSAASVSAAGSIELVKGGSSFIMEGEFVTTEQINVTATTTAHAYIAKEG